MSAEAQTVSRSAAITGSQAVVEALLRCGITSGFGIPSIHNIPIYEALRQCPPFRHWVVRHEQAAVFAADGFYRHSGRIAVVFASTGPGNLFTVAPLLESLQTNTPVLVMGTNIASSLLGKTGGALHETPQQADVFKPLTRYVARVTRPDEIPGAIAAAVEMMRGPLPGPAFIEIPTDFLAAPVSAAVPQPAEAGRLSPRDLTAAAALIAGSKTPAVVLGAGVRACTEAVRSLAERLGSPVFTTTSGKGMIADDHPLAMGCISRLGAVQEVLNRSDLLISLGAKLTEFDTGRFQLQLPGRHLQIVSDANYPGDRIPATASVAGDIGAIAESLAAQVQPRPGWCDIAGIRAQERERLRALNSDAFSALEALREALDRDDVVVNDQSILNYWASAFFPVMAPETFLYPTGSGTLGYALPAAVGAACAMVESGRQRRIVCIAGDGGFQYTQHELATLVQYGLPVKILLVNDQAYGIIGFLQRSLFGKTHEVALKNPDFCRAAEAYGIRAQHATTLDDLRSAMPGWLNSPGPALLEWRTELKAPWEVGAIIRPNLPEAQRK
ncbi:MAG TPA: thiamine pyrophosphate-binding protein [Candidatus Angelobacter sp.]|nr:thiamine pyrophosphate-binding protein [Candidatus Angelobacter sp.]